MKKIRHLLAIAMTLALVMPCPAQSNKNNMGVLQSPNKKVTAWTKSSNDTKFVLTRDKKLVATPKKAPKVTEGEQYTLKFNLVSAEGVHPEQVIITSQTNPKVDHWYVYQDWETGEYVQQVPAGKYDILAKWANWETGNQYLVLKENVTVSGDMEVEINANEAKPIVINAYHPNGELFKTDKYEYDENWNQYLAEKGNVNGVFGFIDIIRKSDNYSLYTEMAYGIPKHSINDLGDNFIYVQNRAYYIEGDEGCIYLNKFYSNGNNSFLENKPEDYYNYERDFFVSSKIGENSEKSMGAYFNTIYNGCCFQDGGIDLGSGNKIRLWVNAPFEGTKKDENLDLLVRPTTDDYQKLNIYEYEDWMTGELMYDTVPEWKHIYAPAMIVDNGTKYIFNGPSIDATMQFLEEMRDGISVRQLYPGNDNFSFMEDQKSSKFGDNTPINIFEKITFDGTDYEYNNAYMGRYGEVRSVDTEALTFKLKANGEEVTTVEGWNGPEPLTYANMNQYLASWGNPDRVKGVIDFEFDNQNVIVDGIQGRNLTTVHMDETAEDNTAPTMTMLQMRDINGKVTDRFEKADDGVLTFSCGDFKPCFDVVAHNIGFECTRPQVEAYYAVNGQDEWTALPFTEDADAYAPVAIGHIFNADLSQVDGEGWFDLKFKVSDAAGNWQEQIVSPAFKIGNTQTGIGGVKVGNATEVGRYTVEGRAISAPQAGVNIVKYSDGTVKKVLVK
ncbi:MAG: hypothetical protein KBT10_06610 [Bacteroidales bacterium]|nr:hypothetical protein [Candidatus Sodaliphilus aphodohippi]